MLVADPGGKDSHSLGSYFVFRKLEQNVRGFKENEKKVAAAVLAPGADSELAGAMLVGRFEGGTPVLLSNTDLNPGPAHQENNFDYAAVGSELKCPFHAHIRKAGPRTDGGGVVFNKTKRLVRRGIPFEDKPRVRNAEGNLSDEPADQPTGGVGLLFMCYVADIKGQFEFVQSSWENSASFSHPGTGKDPIVGQPGRRPGRHHVPVAHQLGQLHPKARGLRRFRDDARRRVLLRALAEYAQEPAASYPPHQGPAPRARHQGHREARRPGDEPRHQRAHSRARAR